MQATIIVNIKDLLENVKPIAVIIKGNHSRMDERAERLAKALYRDITKRLEASGYQVELDAGEPHTLPREDADIWIGFSRGADRLQYAPKGVKTYEIKGKSLASNKDKIANDPSHYVLSDEDINFISNLK